jgi:hypothetical protein
VVITGTMPVICYAEGMIRFLNARETDMQINQIEKHLGLQPAK